MPLIRTMLPLFVFMLLPVWIPIIGLVFGTLADLVVPRRLTPAESAVTEAKARSARLRMPAHAAVDEVVPRERSLAA